jgi:hypothetical protein
MSFSFTYKATPRVKNPMTDNNPLARGTGKVVTLQDRVDRLKKNKAWNETVRVWKARNKMFSLDRLPKVGMFALGKLLIDEDIQRQLDEKHCAKDIADPSVFDEALLQTLQCILTSKGELISIDGQHTATVIAALIEAGLVPENTDWRTFEFAVQYIETDSLSFARRAFSILNGKGKKKQSAYQQLRNSVFIIRIDKDTSNSEDVELERKVKIAERYECYPVEEDSPLLQYPGTFSNIATFKTLNDHELELACAWHHEYFHNDNVHAALFFIFKDLTRSFNAAKLSLTSTLLEELAALIQDKFIKLDTFATFVKKAHREYTFDRWGYEANWNDDAYACALLQLYKHFGGNEKIAPNITDRFEDLYKFFHEDVLNQVEA